MKIKMIVHGLIRDEIGRCLILKRSKNNDVLPNKWDIPGGSVEEGEGLIEALKREVYEETSLEARIIDVFHMVENVDNKKKTHFVKLVFMAMVKKSDVALNPSEHEDYKWINISGIDKYDLLDYVKECISKINR